MTSRFQRYLFVLAISLPGIVRAATAPSAPPPNPLVWDAMELSIVPKPDEHEATFEFHVTNTAREPVEILQLEPSCGCTVAEMPRTPWILAPGSKGSFSALVDHRGKHGKFSKTLLVVSSRGNQMLNMIIDLPDTEESRRARNQQLAFVDRQAVLRGECASCHVTPTIGKMGEALFQTACAICHQASARAGMVPDLAVARGPRDAAYWQTWIADGKERTLMPGFAAKHGGPLTDAQIGSLVDYLLKQFPTAPKSE